MNPRLLALIALQLLLGTAHACRFAQDAQPAQWYEWANSLFSADVTSVEADIHFKREDKVERIDRVLHIAGADAAQKKRMAEIAEKTPVTLTLKRSVEIHTTLA